ncbi:MAG: RIP metalloprotease RseP [Rhodospirillales bacterium]|nr:RIP metalloprotease RseP [Rhodospirillales bacterium]
MLHSVPDLLRSGGAFLVVLGVLVFFHELGHYLAARACGVHVEAFSIGFGRAITTWTDRHGTIWRLSWLPLGGYVKLHGQERPEDAPEEVRARWLPGRTFHEKSVGRRAIVVAAGPAANFLLAAVFFSLLYATAGRPVTLPVVGEVVAHSAAAHAGMAAKDRIVAIDGTPITTFEDIQRIVSAHPATKMDVTVRRDHHDVHLAVTTDTQQVGGKQIGMLGIRGGAVDYVRMGPVQAIGAGIDQTWTVTGDTLHALGQMLGGQRGTGELGGPLRIAQMSGQVAELGLASLISFIAVLSINLGLINLFPIPVLDGGHLLFFLAEAVRGRPIPQRAQEYGYRAGFALLAGLFVFATWNDLSHLGLVHWVAHLLG